MKTLGAIVAICLLAVAPARAYSTLLFGIGTVSCANWLSTPFNQNEGNIWILGYWSGRNDENTVNHNVGIDTDAQGIIGEVRKICVERPSLTLLKASGTAYLNMLDH
jgi:hypothetical protein